jgi:hypothetical protein
VVFGGFFADWIFAAREERFIDGALRVRHVRVYNEG